VTRSSSLAALGESLGGRIEGNPQVQVTSIAHDSRSVQPGALFVALRGAQHDGHDYIPQAIQAGAAAVAVNERSRPIPGVACLRLPDTRQALAALAARFYGEPARGMVLVGVTGTNGKSSTVRMVESILNQAGYRAGSTGTISSRFGGSERPASLTTPEATDLQRTLREMRDAGADAVVVEVSSHALTSGRVRGLRFAAAVFTNLTQDHLDHHGDMVSYAAAKGALFGPEYLGGTAVLNARDARSAEYARLARAGGWPVLRYGRGQESDAHVRTAAERIRLGGSELALETPRGPLELCLPLAGEFQVENALAAIGAALALEVPLSAIRAGLEGCPPVPGRLERVADCEPVVLVDYAHTPDAIDRVLACVRPLVPGRLICVFGCGGDRDPSKRAPMARAACQHADHVIATSDNPRSEDPLAILRAVEQGLRGRYEIVPDRREAIARAVALADAKDVVVIAGKGHEDYQIIGSRRLPFDDRVEARSALRAKGALS
jgi:UDP-N-acetylmuramoyl-L-alanyl-D-glutamate--2,6-diaminopimelate ligase